MEKQEQRKTDNRNRHTNDPDISHRLLKDD